MIILEIKIKEYTVPESSLIKVPDINTDISETPEELSPLKEGLKGIAGITASVVDASVIDAIKFAQALAKGAEYPGEIHSVLKTKN